MGFGREFEQFRRSVFHAVEKRRTMRKWSIACLKRILVRESLQRETRHIQARGPRSVGFLTGESVELGEAVNR